MKASDLLKQQGWRGEGFSLDATNRGIAKPLLVQHKTDAAGLGVKKNDFAGQGQWWLNAFDTSLKDWAAGKKPTKINPRLQAHSGLYSQFVKAATLQGTFTPSTDESTSDPTIKIPAEHAISDLELASAGTDLNDDAGSYISDEKRARKAAKLARRAAKQAKKEEALRKKPFKTDKRKRKHGKHYEDSQRSADEKMPLSFDHTRLSSKEKKEKKPKRRKESNRNSEEHKAAKRRKKHKDET